MGILCLGCILAGAAAAAALVSLAVFKKKKRQLNRQLDNDYGPRQP